MIRQFWTFIGGLDNNSFEERFAKDIIGGCIALDAFIDPINCYVVLGLFYNSGKAELPFLIQRCCLVILSKSLVRFGQDILPSCSQLDT